jgi:hypothetical protein
VLLPNGSREIGGHPSLSLDPAVGPRTVNVTLCANCEKMRTVLFLTGDRWFCMNCKSEGIAKPTSIPLTRGRR